MRAYGKKLTALLLAACMLLGLAACGSGDDGDGQQLSGTVYVPEFMDFDLDLEYIQGGCSDGKNVYLIGETAQWTLKNADGEVIRTLEGSEEAEKYYTADDGSYVDVEYSYGIYRVSLDGGEAVELENYEPTQIPEGMEGSTNISSIRTGADGTLWITEDVYTYKFDLPEDFDPENDDRWEYYTEGENTQIQRQLDSTGSELSRMDTSGLQEKLGWDYLNYMLMDDSGNIYTSTDGKVAVLDKELKPLFTIEEENLWGEMTLLGDGTVGMVGYVNDIENETSKRMMRVIDLEKKGWGAEYELPSSAYTAYTGSDKYLFYYDNNDSLYGYNAETQEGEKILSWISSDINKSNLEFFTFLGDGRVLAMTRDWRGGSGPKIELAILTEQPASVLADKTVLTYATMYLGYDIRNKIIDFNKSSSKYRIEVRDYAEFNTNEDGNAGLTKLNTEIVAGNVPDILDTSNMPIRQYGAKGILEDLWPMIDSDPDISRDDLMENVFKAAEQDGKLYQVFSSFSISTVGGAPGVVGDRMSWTVEDLQQALSSMPEGCQIFSESDTKSGMLTSVLAQNLGSFVNWETGECSFNTDEFKAMLEFCNAFPLEYNWEEHQDDEYEDEPSRISSGKQMLLRLSLYDFQSIQMYKAMFGGSIAFVGYPREDGSVGSSFSIGSGMAISSTCKDKEGAWSFVRQLILPLSDEEGYYYGTFPTHTADFDKMVEENMKVEYELDENGKPRLDENGEPIQVSNGGWGWGSLDINIYATTQEEYDQIMALYNAIDSVSGYDEEIFEIVQKAAAAYFSGDMDLNTTADQIQSSVKLYINESR